MTANDLQVSHRSAFDFDAQGMGFAVRSAPRGIARAGAGYAVDDLGPAAAVGGGTSGR